MRASFHTAVRIASRCLHVTLIAGLIGVAERPVDATDDSRLVHVLDPCSSAHVVLSRALVDEMLEALDEPTTCNIIPAFQGGRAIGLKIFGVRPDSFKARLCLRNGDVVTHVLGYDLSTPERVGELRAVLGGATHVDVALRRDGEPIRMTYFIE